MDREELERQLAETKQQLENCINELCLICNKYENEHEGACDGCRWRDMKW